MWLANSHKYLFPVVKLNAKLSTFNVWYNLFFLVNVWYTKCVLLFLDVFIQECTVDCRFIFDAKKGPHLFTFFQNPIPPLPQSARHYFYY